MHGPAATSLISQAMAGDAHAFGILMEPLYEDAYRLALGLVGDRPTAEDVVQDSLLRAWRFMPRFHKDRPLRPWFMTIVANQSRTQLAAQRHRRQSTALDLAADSEDAVEALDLRRALLHLDHAPRLALMLRFYFDMEYEEIAAIVGSSPGAARKRVSRAIGDLRREMGQARG